MAASQNLTPEPTLLPGSKTTTGRISKPTKQNHIARPSRARAMPLLYSIRHDINHEHLSKRPHDPHHDNEAVTVLKKTRKRVRAAGWACAAPKYRKGSVAKYGVCGQENANKEGRCTKCKAAKSAGCEKLDWVVAAVCRVGTEEWRVVKRFTAAAEDEDVERWEKEEGMGKVWSDTLGKEAFEALEVMEEV